MAPPPAQHPIKLIGTKSFNGCRATCRLRHTKTDPRAHAGPMLKHTSTPAPHHQSTPKPAWGSALRPRARDDSAPQNLRTCSRHRARAPTTCMQCPRPFPQPRTRTVPMPARRLPRPLLQPTPSSHAHAAQQPDAPALSPTRAPPFADEHAARHGARENAAEQEEHAEPPTHSQPCPAPQASRLAIP
ncbi:hypothetical protein FIBSPDRAFT_947098 [Athelia psychrophila]|uniref:Uncharacterized protein n=1 Tax=Athelia psychrophila TaxID=1759441 RepID=A0A166S748_9AGAM|nr:hypothetical protein FIBSPDRAFT_947098 [Fibularhizoctonia sp. CBS 109695]